MPKYTDPESGKTISSKDPLSEDEITEAFALQLTNTEKLMKSSSNPVSRFVETMLSNVVPDIEKIGKGFLGMLADPGQIANTLKGTDVLLREQMGQKIPPEMQELKKYPISWFNMQKERVTHPLETIQKEPVQSLWDISTILGLTPGLSKVGRAIEPINILKEVTSLPLAAIPKTAKISPEGLMKSAVKMPKTERWSAERRLKAAETMVEKGIKPTERSYYQLWDTITEVADDVKGKVEALSQGGATVSGKAIVKELDSLRQQYWNKPDPTKYLDALSDFENNFLAAHDWTGRGIPLEKAYAIKQEVYRSQSRKYNSPIPPPVSPAFEMGIARGIRKEMEKKYPEEMAFLKQEGELLNVEEGIRGAVKRIADRDLMGIGAPVKVGVSHAVTGKIGVGTALALLDSPWFKATLAIELGKIRGAKLGKFSTLIRQLGVQGQQISEMETINQQKDLSDKAQQPNVR